MAIAALCGWQLGTPREMNTGPLASAAPAASAAPVPNLASPPHSPPPSASAPAMNEPAPVVPALLDERSLMAELRRAKDSDSELAVALARDANQRFRNSNDAPERTSILIHALSALGRNAEARGEAEDMVNRYPDSEWVREIERFSGAHRHRNVRVNARGELEYY